MELAWIGSAGAMDLGTLLEPGDVHACGEALDEAALLPNAPAMLNGSSLTGVLCAAPRTHAL